MERLREIFGEEELLRVPGFYRPEADLGGGSRWEPGREPKQIRFSLYGDYALIPYHDAEGYITTVEGRLIGEPKNGRDKKYKALLGSGVHLYVHPRFEPGEVVAFCEGAIGAMVAARYGIPVAAIKGFRNYKVSARERGGEDRILPELEGVGFAGRQIAYVPDVDVKPKSREEVMGAVPAACEWLIARQGGVPKVALLPEGAKDLDAWLLSLPEERRAAEAQDLLSGAVSLAEWRDPVEDVRRPEHANGHDRSDADRPASGQCVPGSARPSGATGGKRDLLDDDGDTPVGGVPASAPGGATEAKPQAAEETPNGRPPGAPGHRRPKEAEDANLKGGPDRRREGPAGSSPTAYDAERARKGPMHPAMARWYEVAGYTDEQVAEARQKTAVRKITGKNRPPVRDTPVSLPKWTAGEVILALAVALAVALALCVLAYAMRDSAGTIGTVGELITWPTWWLEATLYAWAGTLAANWLVARRHRARRRQLRAHLRGED